MPCKLLYVIQVKGFLIKCSILALLDIRVFGRLYLWLLIGLAFFTVRLFLFSISLLFVSIQNRIYYYKQVVTRNRQFLHPGCFLIAYGYYVEAYETDATLKS